MTMARSLTKRQLCDLSTKINYQFHDIALLELALSHPSLKQLDNTHHVYERLEFLGDSILGFVVAEMLFLQFPDSTESHLAKIKAHLVSHTMIVKIANIIDLSQYIIMTQGEEVSGGRVNNNNIENAMEALIGAMYLDSDIMQVKKMITSFWSQYVGNVDLISADPKTYIQEFLQKDGRDAPTYNVIERQGPAHSPRFTISATINDYCATATGKSIKEAEKNVAIILIEKLSNNH